MEHLLAGIVAKITRLTFKNYSHFISNCRQFRFKTFLSVKYFFFWYFILEFHQKTSLSYSNGRVMRISFRQTLLNTESNIQLYKAIYSIYKQMSPIIAKMRGKSVCSTLSIINSCSEPTAESVRSALCWLEGLSIQFCSVCLTLHYAG